MIRNLAKLTAALLILAALMGADSSCGNRGDVDTNRPRSERQADPKATRIVFITANSNGPYTVHVIASEVGKQGRDETTEQVAGGEYKQELSYTSGLRIEIRVLVYGNAKDEMRCSIVDGTNRDHQRRNKEVLCLLTTSR